MWSPLARADLDITDPDRVTRVVAAAAPRAIVNCAAFTDVDGAEAARGARARVNGDGAGHVARAAAAAGARVVHVSTDYVFDGDQAASRGVSPTPSAPLQAYGRTKLAGELAVAEAGAEHAIVRTAWLFGAGGPNFVDTMLRLGAERDEVTVVTDQVGCPTWTGHLAPALVEVAERAATSGSSTRRRAAQCSWYEFAVEIFDRAGWRCRVVPTTTARVRAPGAAPGLQRARHRARAGALVAAALAGRPRRLPRRSEGVAA